MDVLTLNLPPTVGLTDEQYYQLCLANPEWQIELRSKTDSLNKLREKMQEYRDNGTRLGWLLDPKTPSVEIYRPGTSVEILTFPPDSPPKLSGEEVLPGFTLDLALILNP